MTKVAQKSGQVDGGISIAMKGIYVYTYSYFAWKFLAHLFSVSATLWANLRIIPMASLGILGMATNIH